MTKPRVDQDALRTRVVGQVRQQLPGLSDQEAVDALHTSRCYSLRSLLALERHLSERPDALLKVSSHVPVMLVRLAHALQGQGRRDVALPTCAGCGQPKPRLASVDSTGGRLCERCAQARVAKRSCARCGRLQRIEARRPEGGICGRCAQADPTKHEPCAACGRTRRVACRLPDGSGLCQTCMPKRLQECSSCGTAAAAHAIGEQGPICEACYRRPERVCGGCGRTRRIHRRATADTPDLCGSCYQGVEATCTVCGRIRLCRRNRATGDPVCASCRPEPQRLCSFCSQVRRLRAVWPAGPVCESCYRTTRANPADCADCSNRRVLIGQNPAGDPICGPCAGVETDYVCRTCGQPGDLYAAGACDRCVLAERVDNLLTGPGGAIDARLQPLGTALRGVPRPRSTLVWMSRCPLARLLVELAHHPDRISHEYLDQSVHRQAVHYLRGILVRTGVLAGRDEHLERIAPWVDRLLTEQPQHARYLRPFVHWYLLPRARRRARRRPSTAYSARTLRGQVLAALDLLTWIHDHGTTLDCISQHDVDEWLTTGTSGRYEAALFLRWATSRRLTTDGGLIIPPRRTKTPGPFLDAERQTVQLHRCIHNSSLPLDVRVAGALLVLFGVPVPRITALTTANVIIDNDQRDPPLSMRFGETPIQLPPALADLISQLLEKRRDPSAASSGVDHVMGPTPYLFPGMIAGQPSSPSALTGKLNRHGITAFAARNSACRALAEQLPAAVVADLLNINISTAISWARQTKADWTTYVAQRPKRRGTDIPAHRVRDIIAPTRGDHREEDA